MNKDSCSKDLSELVVNNDNNSQENVITQPSLNKTSISHDSKADFVTASVSATDLKDNAAFTLLKASLCSQNENMLSEKFPSTEGSLSPEIDTEKIIMDLGKSTEWGDLSAVKEIVVSPQLDILELQWNEIINKQDKNVFPESDTVQESQNISSNTIEPGNEILPAEITINSDLFDINFTTPKETLNVPSNLTTTDFSDLWSNVENNNYFVQDAVGFLDSNLEVGDRFIANTESTKKCSHEKLDKSTNTSNVCTSGKATFPSVTALGEAVTLPSDKNGVEITNECNCKKVGERMENCCVIVCLKTLNSLRKVLESGCCKNSFLETNCCKRDSIINTPLAATSCCSGN